MADDGRASVRRRGAPLSLCVSMSKVGLLFVLLCPPAIGIDEADPDALRFVASSPASFCCSLLCLDDCEEPRGGIDLIEFKLMFSRDLTETSDFLRGRDVPSDVLDASDNLLVLEAKSEGLEEVFAMLVECLALEAVGP